MNKKLLISIAGIAALSLVGCGGAESTKSDGDKGGADASGSGAKGDVSGKALGSDNMLSKRRVYFAFDSSAIDNESRAIVEAHAKHLAANKSIKVVFEGHADERGSREYNLALGERRAQAVQRMAKLLGVGGDRIKVVSYGEEKPVAAGHDEASWSQNRRVEIIY